MSYRLACDLSSRIAAIAPVAADMGGYRCKPSRPVPLIAFHGTDDNIIHYEGGKYSVEDWAAINECSEETEVVFQRGKVTCVAYKGCKQNATVEFCTIKGGGHTWPGAIDLLKLDPVKYRRLGQTTQDIDGSQAIWEFFSEHPRPND
ncbi:MAG: alpha/beta hydrolase family esterase [Candidatus Hodarchaeota archaeon]